MQDFWNETFFVVLISLNLKFLLIIAGLYLHKEFKSIFSLSIKILNIFV